MYHVLFSDLLKSGVRFAPTEEVGQPGQTSQSEQAGQVGQTQTGETSQTQQQGKNNEKDNVDKFATLWDNPTEDKPGEKASDQTPDANKGLTNQQVFDEHINSLNLLNGVDLEKITADLTSGNTESLENAFKAMSRNVYTSALLNTNKIMDQKIEAAIEQAVTKSKNSIGSDFALQQMNSQLPFTAKPAIAPMAKQVLEQLIKKGSSTEEAIAGVKDYFQQTASVFAKESGLVIAPKNRPGSGRFTDAALPDTLGKDEDDVIDFIKILGGDQEEA